MKELNLIGEHPFAFTSGKGFDFFTDSLATKYARKVGHGKKLLGWTVYVVAKDGEPIERVLFDNKNKPRYSTTNFEQMACHIDMLRLALERKI